MTGLSKRGQWWISAIVIIALTGCGDDDTTPEDMGRPARLDGALPDGNVFDGDIPDMVPVDLAPPDMPVDAAMLSPTSEQILAVRDAAVGDLALPIDGATVTYAIPAIGSDPAGFFVQDQRLGPALFVAVDPSTLSPAPEAGDVVSFQVDQTMRFLGQLRVVAISGLTRDSTGADVGALAADVSEVVDVASNLPLYESELITIRGELGSESRFAGTGFEQWKLVTASVDETLLVARAPESLDSAAVFGVGCTVEIGPTPLWRHRAEAMAMAWSATDITVIDCPAPALRDAVAVDDDQVLLRFNRPIDPATFDPGDLLFTPALTPSAVSVDGTLAVVDTSLLTVGEDYTVTVDEVSDTGGTAIDAATNSDSFAGVRDTIAPGEGDLVLTEILANAGEQSDALGLEWIELFNPQSAGGQTYQLRGCSVSLRDGQGDPQPIEWSFVVRPRDFAVIGGRPVGEPPGVVRLRPRLPDEGDAITLDCGGVVDTVDYAQPGFPRPAGASMQLAASVGTATENDNPAAWCAAPADRVYGSFALRGTPGMVNSPCSDSP